ncbi:MULTISPECIES: hypothetical protein [unclassified Pseudomonas]|uniref:hypothetical protein n=1 Tax=unclassified Pseudomonas TaxID=196821 RepID=UPI00131C34A4|nr:MULTISPECIES: hypothetical protein [unclassified Pseudomonas]
MSNQLLPCPFCGGAAKSSVPFRGTQKAWCNAEGCENKSTFDVEAWNRRATQPAAGEPVYQWRFRDDKHWIECSHKTFEQYSEAPHAVQTRVLWTAPPAAAHGDEAVLWIECDPSAAKFDRLPKDWQFLFSTKFHMTDPGDRSANVVFALHSALRAQAGEGGEV